MYQVVQAGPDPKTAGPPAVDAPLLLHEVDPGDVQVRPGNVLIDEVRQEDRREGRTAVASSGVDQVREGGPRRLLDLLILRGQAPEAFAAAPCRGQ